MSLLRKTGKFKICQSDGHLTPLTVTGVIETVIKETVRTPNHREISLVEIVPDDGSPTVTRYILKPMS